MAIEMTVIELVCIAEKAIITSSRTALIPTRHLIAGHVVEMEEAECSPRQFWKRGRFLDQPFPDADAPLGGLPENYASLPVPPDPLNSNFLLLDLILDLNGPTQRIGQRREKILIRLLRSNAQ